MPIAHVVKSRPSPAGGDRLHGLAPRVQGLLRDAARHLQRNDLAAAERALTGALALAANHPESARLEGLLLHRQGRANAAALAFARSLEQRPDDAPTLVDLAGAQTASGDIDASLDTLRRACALAPGFAPAWFELAKRLNAYGDMEETHDAFARFLKLEPDHRLARIGLADSLKALGRIDQAAAHYRRVIAEDPRMFQAWFSLVDLKTVRLDAGEIGALERLADDPALPPIGRAAVGFALGKVREDGARPAEAFAAFTRANAIMRASGQWNAAAFSGGVDAVIAAFDKASSATTSELGSEVIFVTSLPRAGSTLVETILAAHAEVEGASELPDLAAVIGEETRRRGIGFPQWIDAMTDADWQRLGRRYLERTARWRARCPRFTDKMPSNWRLLGAALRMLPGARIVDCRRDVLETCWSCYKQLFAPGRADYAYDFADLAAYRDDYERLMDFWQQHHRERIRTQSYEALVADPASEIRDLLEFSGLPFDPACIEFHRAERTTRTASAAQVRQPLRRDSARTAAYGKLLDPLRSALHLEIQP